jgi:2-polyprenyl-3-methyl-5-hydroxy-6-metoxy-1,4-benzoquinol methylase
MDKYKLTIDTYNKSAKSFQDKFMNMDLYNDTYDKFCKSIVVNKAEIFEIACGPGNITKYLLTKRPDFKITAIDLSPKMLELAKANNPTVDFQLMDCRDIDKLDKKFDAIMCGFCLPYLSREESANLISDSAKLLKGNGLIYISTMEGDYEKSGFETTSFSGQDKIYVHYHQADYLKTKLFENGFEKVELICKDYPEQNGTFTTDMIFIAKKIKTNA